MSVSAPPSVSVVFFESHGELPAGVSRAANDACGHALKAVVASRPGQWRLLVGSGDAQQAFALQLAREAGLAAEALTGDSSEWRATADARLVLYAGERPAAPTGLRGAALWTAVRASDGQRWEADAATGRCTRFSAGPGVAGPSKG